MTRRCRIETRADWRISVPEESPACCDAAWTSYMASYIRGPSSSSAGVGLRQQTTTTIRTQRRPKSPRRAVESSEYRGLAAGLGVWRLEAGGGCGGLWTGGVSTGREDGIMYSDSSPSPASSPAAGLWAGESLGATKKKQY